MKRMSKNMEYRGFCALAAPMSACDDEASPAGLWPMASAYGLREACVARCKACARCRYVSFADVAFAGSRGLQLAGGAAVCSWYTVCDTGDLRHWWDARIAGANWTTLRVRTPTQAVVAPPARRHTAANETRVRIGIAALTFGKGRECNLVGWCQGARRLQRALDVRPWRVDLIILHTGPHPDLRPYCPAAVFVRASPQLRRTAEQCLSRHPIRTGPPVDAMLKWQFFSMTEFDVVLHVDADIDVMPIELQPSLVLTRWRESLPVFLLPRRLMRVDGLRRSARSSAGMRLLGQTDFTSPLNGGLLLLRPSAALYKDGLAELRRCHFNRTHGWGLIGAPRSLGLAPRYFSPQAGGSTRRRPAWQESKAFWFVPPTATGVRSPRQAPLIVHSTRLAPAINRPDRPAAR